MKAFRYLAKFFPAASQFRKLSCGCDFQTGQPLHLICFKDWTTSMVLDIIYSAINLKCRMRDTHCKRLNILQHCKVMILQEINEPILNMAVSKAVTLLGANDTTIIDKMVWSQDHNGRLFSYMADAIFVATSTHHCVVRFAKQALVPVICMRSRTHASIQALSTIMAIIEEFGSMQCVNLGYIGPAHPVLNSYLLLCPMLGANINFVCACTKCPVTPLLLKASEEMINTTHTTVKKCSNKTDVLKDARVIIAAPTTTKLEKIEYFKFTLKEVNSLCQPQWIFFHTCPRGDEVDDDLFYHDNTRTFNYFDNMQYIAAALLANCIKGQLF